MKLTDLSDKVFRFAEDNALFSLPCHLVVAVSGGADSMALLHTLLHWPQRGMQLSIVHMNHGLRGESAVRDEKFVHEFCSMHNLSYYVFHEDVAAFSVQQKMTLEEAGRTLRYRKFEELRQQLEADYIVTAHTASDQVETMLMYLLRGCGLDALRGIAVKNGHICRPLLACTREEVESYCRENDIAYITDETNSDLQFTRNRIRHRLIPMLQEINPQATDSLLRFQHHITEDINFLEDAAQNLLEEATVNDLISVMPFVTAPLPIRRRAIRLMLRNYPLQTVEESHICAIEHILLTGSGQVLLPKKYTAQVQNGTISITNVQASEPPIHLSVSEFPVTFMVCGKQYTISILSGTEAINVHNLFANRVIDYDTIHGSLVVRTRCVGDNIRPAGRGVTKSLKKLMNEWKIPLDQRDMFPILCDESGVLLIPGYACAQRAAITDETQRYLVIHS